MKPACSLTVKNENIREPENQNSEQNQNNKLGEMSESKQI